MTEYTYQQIQAYAAENTPPGNSIVAFEYDSASGQPMVCKLKLEPGYVRCPACGDGVQRLYATRRGLACGTCKNASGTCGGER
jgi:hypothetical protein